MTLLGDAIHAMSPARGSGANTALQDAGLLCSTLAVGSAEHDGLVTAIGDYETEMRNYGFAALEASRRAEAQLGTQGHRLASWLYRRFTNRRHNAS